MQRNTITTLIELKEGDCFTYLQVQSVWQVVGFLGNNVLINQYNESGNQLHKFHIVKMGKARVKFLRNANTTEEKA